MQNQRSRRQKGGIPVTFANGVKAIINPKDVPEELWKRHSGTALNGIKVSSLKSCQIPGSDAIFLQNDAGTTLCTTQAELEVFVTQVQEYLTSPAAASASA